MSDPTSLVEGLSESWRELLKERLAVISPEGISFMEQDTITSIMETLADIANQCMLHYLKLAFYQSTLDSEVEDKPAVESGFRQTL